MLAPIAIVLCLAVPPQTPDYRALAEQALAAAPADTDTRFRLQIVAGRYAEALATLHAMPPNVANVRWEIYAKAKASGASALRRWKKSGRKGGIGRMVTTGSNDATMPVIACFAAAGRPALVHSFTTSATNSAPYSAF